jgi:hypothetical protein
MRGTSEAAVRVLVANEPPVYREVIAGALRKLRPAADVVVTEPKDLDAAFAHYQPHLVICTVLTQLVRDRGPSWLLLYPNGEGRAAVKRIGATAPEYLNGASISLATYLELVDDTTASIILQR